MKFINDKDVETLKKLFASYPNDLKLFYFQKKEDCESCQVAGELYDDVASLSDKISLTVYDLEDDSDVAEKYGIDKVPALVIEGEKDFGIRFYGVPSGYEFNSLLNALKNVSDGSHVFPGVIKEDLDGIEHDIHVQVFVTPNCPHCPAAVKTAHNFAMYSDKIKADMIEISEFPEMAEKYKVLSVPMVVINENINFVGALSDREYLEKILKAK